MRLKKFKSGIRKYFMVLGCGVLLAGMMGCGGVQPDAEEAGGRKIEADSDEGNGEEKADGENKSETGEEQEKGELSGTGSFEEGNQSEEEMLSGTSYVETVVGLQRRDT